MMFNQNIYSFSVPEELTYDYTNRQYQDVRKRPELNYASVEFIAPSEYMVCSLKLFWIQL